MKDVADNAPVFELKVNFDAEDLAATAVPVASVENKGKQVVSVDSSATAIFVALSAVPDVS